MENLAEFVESCNSIVGNMVDSHFVEGEFKLQSHYYIPFLDKQSW